MKRNPTLIDQEIAARSFEDYRNGRDLPAYAASFTGTAALCDECEQDRARVLKGERKLCLRCADNRPACDLDDEPPSSRRAAAHLRDWEEDGPAW